jgi:hypothetical protein
VVCARLATGANSVRAAMKGSAFKKLLMGILKSALFLKIA